MASKSLETRPQKPPSLGLFPKVPHQAPGVEISGQVAVVAGANSGLGFHCARHLLGLKLSHLILAVGSKKKGEEAMDKLKNDLRNQPTRMEELLWLLVIVGISVLDTTLVDLQLEILRTIRALNLKSWDEILVVFKGFL
jgi:hypothetical protein